MLARTLRSLNPRQQRWPEGLEGPRLAVVTRNLAAQCCDPVGGTQVDTGDQADGQRTTLANPAGAHLARWLLSGQNISAYTKVV